MNTNPEKTPHEILPAAQPYYYPNKEEWDHKLRALESTFTLLLEKIIKIEKALAVWISSN